MERQMLRFQGVSKYILFFELYILLFIILTEGQSSMQQKICGLLCVQNILAGTVS
jgi:hypothetical protein